MSDIVRVPFHGDEILAIDVDGRPHVVLKPAIEGLGLDYPTQYNKLRGRSWASIGQRPIQVPGDDQRRDMVTCDVRTFLMLLANVDERRVGKNVRPRLVTYQAEVADVIESYWTNGGAINPRATDAQLDAIIGRARSQLEVLKLADGLVDPAWLEAKTRHVVARSIGEEPEVNPADRPLTIGEYLDEKGLTAKATRTLSPMFGKQVKHLYRQQHGQEPPKVERFVSGALRGVAGYTERDRPLLDHVWSTYVEDAS